MADINAIVFRNKRVCVARTGQRHFASFLQSLAVDDDALLFTADGHVIFSALRVDGYALRRAGFDLLDELLGFQIHDVERAVASVIEKQSALVAIDLEIVETAFGIWNFNR